MTIRPSKFFIGQRVRGFCGKRWIARVIRINAFGWNGEAVYDVFCSPADNKGKSPVQTRNWDTGRMEYVEQTVSNITESALCAA